MGQESRTFNSKALQDTPLEDDDVIVSFDVVRLFTRVPVERKTGWHSSIQSHWVTSLRKTGYTSHRNTSPPQLYRLLKIHKPEVPLRPIVSAVNSPTYSLSKELARILILLARHTEPHVNNSAHFAQEIQDTTLEDVDVMVSFDVVSLFTRVYRLTRLLT